MRAVVSLLIHAPLFVWFGWLIGQGDWAALALGCGFYVVLDLARIAMGR